MDTLLIKCLPYEKHIYKEVSFPRSICTLKM